MLIQPIPIILAAVVPMITGFIWYNKNVFGTTWMRESGVTEDKMKGANMPLIFGGSFILSIMLAVSMYPLTVHQMHIGSLFQGDPAASDPTSPTGMLLQQIQTATANNFRTFKHGAFHGFLSAVFIILPVLGTNALFERKSFKYLFINVGYWAVTFAIMGAIICGMK